MSRTVTSIFAVLLALAAQLPARAQVSGGGPYLPTEAPAQGLRYHVGRDQLIIEATVTQTVTGHVDEDLAVVRKSTTERRGTVATRPIADERMVFSLDADVSSRSAIDLQIEVSEEGLLRSVNHKSEGKSGAILRNVARFVGTFLGFGGLTDALAGPLGVTPWTETDRHSGITRATVGQEGCDVSQPEFLELSRLTRATLKQSRRACEAWRAGRTIQTALGEQKASLMELEAQIATGQPKGVLIRIEALRASIDRLNAELAAQNLVITSAQADFSEKNGIGSRSRTETFKVSLGTDDVPNGGISPGSKKEDVEKALAGYAASLAFFKQTGIVVTLAAPAASLGTIGSTPVDKKPCERQLTMSPGSSKGQTVNVCKSAHLFYRAPVLLDLRVFSLDEGAEPDTVVLASQQHASILHHASPLKYLQFAANAWTNSDLGVTLNNRGIPTIVARKSGAAGEAVTAALADSIASVREEYLTTLTKVVEIQDKQKQLDLADLGAEIEKVTKQKELIEAQLALEGKEVNYRTLLEQQRLTSELAALEARIALQSAQATEAMRLEISELSTQLAQLQLEIQLLKARADMEGMQQVK